MTRKSGSCSINTEMGSYLDSPELARLDAETLDRYLPKYAYRLDLNDAGGVEWQAREDGREIVYQREPKTSFWRRFSAGFYGMLPTKGQL